MNIKMDVSEVLLFLELMKKQKHAPNLKEMNFLLFQLESYNDVKSFVNKLDELKIKPPFVFYLSSLIHFIEDYQDCINLKNKILQTQRKRRRRFSILFIHQIMLSKSEEESLSIIKQADEYGVNLGEVWSKRYDSLWQIKRDQKEWKENAKKLFEVNGFTEIFETFQEMKFRHFEKTSLSDLKNILLENKANDNDRKIIQTTVFERSVYIKEFARRVANGVCQLCDRVAPFKDKHGKPFLEVHHIHYLSKGGSDTIDNVVALCPNCHRKIHHLELSEDNEKIKQKALENIQL